MLVKFTTFRVCKRFPLTITRGTTSSTDNLWIRLEADEIEGWGEASPFSVVKEELHSTKNLIKEIEEIAPELSKFHPQQREALEESLVVMNVSSSIRAAISMALYDWMGKKAGLPLWYLWGLDQTKIKPTSVTIGINTAEGARKRVEAWQKLVQPEVLKLKLGNPEGIGADQAMVLAVKAAAPQTSLTVDANGGWQENTAIFMCEWLAKQGVIYVEQPLPVNKDPQLQKLKERSPLPIFIDESCFNAQDIVRLAPAIDGINIKIMKAGGITEVIKMINIAKTLNLKIMFGCYSDSILANTAMAHLSPLADYLDLDSHLNFTNDPFKGAQMNSGKLCLSNLPGLGVTHGGDFPKL